MTKVGGWIWLENQEFLLEQLCELVGEDLDDGVRKVLEDDIRNSDGDAEPERWASHEFDGPRPIRAHFAHDKGTHVLRVELDVPAEMAKCCETTMHLMSRYHFVRR